MRRPAPGGPWRCRSGGWRRCGARTALGSSCSAASSGSVGDGSATSAFSCRPQGRRGRLPSLTRRRTCSLSSCAQRASVAKTCSGCATMKGRIANSAVKRCVSACSTASATRGLLQPAAGDELAHRPQDPAFQRAVAAQHRVQDLGCGLEVGRQRVLRARRRSAARAPSSPARPGRCRRAARSRRRRSRARRRAAARLLAGCRRG